MSEFVEQDYVDQLVKRNIVPLPYFFTGVDIDGHQAIFETVSPKEIQSAFSGSAAFGLLRMSLLQCPTIRFLHFVATGKIAKSAYGR
jgi:hypothetical protein